VIVDFDQKQKEKESEGRRRDPDSTRTSTGRKKEKPVSNSFFSGNSGSTARIDGRVAGLAVLVLTCLL
jgi:hypothetical protein